MRMSLPKDVPENWNRWIHRTRWLLAAGAFLLPAPVGLAEPNQRPILIVVRLAIAALVALMFLPLKLWSQRRHLRIWGAVATVFSLLSIMSLVSYEQLKQSWTVSYAGKRLVAGTVLTPDAANYHQANPALTAAELLEDAAGDPQGVDERVHRTPTTEVECAAIRAVSPRSRSLCWPWFNPFIVLAGKAIDAACRTESWFPFRLLRRRRSPGQPMCLKCPHFSTRLMFTMSHQLPSRTPRQAFCPPAHAGPRGARIPCCPG